MDLTLDISYPKPEFVDARGGITKVLDDGKTTIKSILYITSEKGSVRANHKHLTDEHHCWLVYGKMLYSEERDGIKISTVLTPGAFVRSPAGIPHKMEFIEDSAFFAFATNSRHQQAYEEDTVGVQI